MAHAKACELYTALPVSEREAEWTLEQRDLLHGSSITQWMDFSVMTREVRQKLAETLEDELSYEVKITLGKGECDLAVSLVCCSLRGALRRSGDHHAQGWCLPVVARPGPRSTRTHRSVRPARPCRWAGHSASARRRTYRPSCRRPWHAVTARLPRWTRAWLRSELSASSTSDAWNHAKSRCRRRRRCCPQLLLRRAPACVGDQYYYRT